MKLFAKLLTGIGVLLGLGYLGFRCVGEKLHLCRCLLYTSRLLPVRRCELQVQHRHFPA